MFNILFLGLFSPGSDPPHKIMRYWFYYSTQLGFHFHLINTIRWKCFVPQLYQFRSGISGEPGLKYFCMIHRGGRMCHTCELIVTHMNESCRTHVTAVLCVSPTYYGVVTNISAVRYISKETSSNRLIK